jgi:hypothetical protein
MIALVPLDNRPCNTRFPEQIARIGGDELLLPPSSLLGFFNSPGEPSALAEWIRALPLDIEALIVSVDMLAYGGLVASRRPDVPVEEAVRHLEVLREFQAQRPHVKIYAFNILMRLAITMDGDEAVAHYYNIMRYARLADEAERFDSAYLKEELRKVTLEIPPPLLQSYLAARARNHEVNRRMVEWLAAGTFDTLLVTQEDATEWGLHRREQDDLLGLKESLGVGASMSLHPGADEAALSLLARHWATGVSFRAHVSGGDDYERIAPFEDRPYHLGLRQHVAAMSGSLCDWDRAQHACDEPCDFELFVNAPVGGSQHDEKEKDRVARLERVSPWLDALQSAVESGRAVALCDVAFPNGADNVVLSELERRRLLGSIEVFAGWNTAGNTTGTVLAHCAALKKARGENADRNGHAAEHAARTAELSRGFTFERLVDDWFYQAKVRSRVERAARERGVSPLRMNERDNERCETQARRELQAFAQMLAARHFHAPLDKCEVSLPWRRTFEVDVRARLATSAPVPQPVGA